MILSPTETGENPTGYRGDGWELGGGVTQMFIHAANPLNPPRQLWAKYSVFSKIQTTDNSICRDCTLECQVADAGKQ